MSGRVVILGATGLVGRTVLRLLEERNFPARELRLLAGPNGEGRTIPFRGRPIPVAPVSRDGFADSDLALFTCKNAISQEWAPVACAMGVRVVDNSSAFRYDVDVPLVVRR
jgi:aspartate-semialdehyde dehydrogenase